MTSVIPDEMLNIHIENAVKLVQAKGGPLSDIVYKKNDVDKSACTKLNDFHDEQKKMCF